MIPIILDVPVDTKGMKISPVSYVGKYKTVTSAATTGVGTTADADLSVPAGKKWAYAVISVSVTSTGNTVDIRNDDDDSAWEPLTDVTTERTIYFAKKFGYPLVAGTRIRARVTENSGATKQVTLKAWVLEY